MLLSTEVAKCVHMWKTVYLVLKYNKGWHHLLKPSQFLCDYVFVTACVSWMAIFIFVCMFEMLPATSHTYNMAKHRFEATVQLEMKEDKKGTRRCCLHGRHTHASWHKCYKSCIRSNCLTMAALSCLHSRLKFLSTPSIYHVFLTWSLHDVMTMSIVKSEFTTSSR